MFLWTNTIHNSADLFLNWSLPPNTTLLKHQTTNKITLFLRNHAYLITLPCFSFSTFCYSTSRLFVLILCLEYYQLGERFEKVIEQERYIGKVLEKFDFMRKITGKSRQWTNGLVIISCMSVLTFLATVPQITRQNDTFDVIILHLFIFAQNLFKFYSVLSFILFLNNITSNRWKK